MKKILLVTTAALIAVSPASGKGADDAFIFSSNSVESVLDNQPVIAAWRAFDILPTQAKAAFIQG